jgi:hypothetical protein
MNVSNSSSFYNKNISEGIVTRRLYFSQIQDCGMVLEEQPGKVSEAFRLFLQGQGYGK